MEQEAQYSDMLSSVYTEVTLLVKVRTTFINKDGIHLGIPSPMSQELMHEFKQWVKHTGKWSVNFDPCSHGLSKDLVFISENSEVDATVIKVVRIVDEYRDTFIDRVEDEETK
jgi:hypothetical protein